MSWSTPNFQIGNSVIELPQSINFEQSFEEFGGVTTHRMMSGAAIRQTNWSKLRTTMTGDGFLPPGIHGVDWKSSQTLKCGATRSLSSTSNVITLPAARRTDTGYTPTAVYLKDGLWKSTAVSVVDNVATCTTASGAVAYMVEYYPQITVFIDPPNITWDRMAGKYRWSITAEEV